LNSVHYSTQIENSEFKDFILKSSEKMLAEMSTEELIKLSFGDIENAIHNFKKS
jgi:hypothetical protein